MSKKSDNGAGKPPDPLDWEEINRLLSDQATEAERGRDRELRKELPFNPWPVGVFVGEVTAALEELRGEFGLFSWIGFALITHDAGGGDGPVPGDGEILQCIIPRGNLKAGDFHGLRPGSRFAGMYRGKQSSGGIDRHDLTIRRL